MKSRAATRSLMLRAATRSGLCSLALLLSGCWQAGQGYDLTLAQAQFDAVPTLSASEFAQPIAHQALRFGVPGNTATPALMVGADPAAQATDSLPPALGTGSPTLALHEGEGCEALGALGGQRALLVAAFAEDLPASDLIFSARVRQAALAECLDARGIDVQFETRLGLGGDAAPAQVLVYTQ